MRQFTFAMCAIAVLVTAPVSFGQVEKRSLTHEDYDGWKSVGGQALSADGKWLAVTVRPQVGDGELVVRSTTGKTEYRHARGTGARFTEDGRWVVFTISPARADQLAYEKGRLEKSGSGGRGRGGARRGRGPGGSGSGGRGGDGEEDNEKPLSAMGIMNLADGKVEVIDRVKGFGVPEEGPAFVVYHLEKPKPEKKPDEDEGGEGEEKEGGERSRRRGRRGGRGRGRADGEKDKTPDYRKDGTPFVVRDLVKGSDTRIDGVTSYGLTRKKGIVWFACNSKKDDEKVVRGLFAIDLASGQRKTLVEGAANYSGIATDREVTRMVFVSDRRDREAKKPTSDLYAWDLGAEPAKRIVSHVETPGFPKGRSVAAARGGGGGGGRSRRPRRGRRGGGGGSGLTFCREGKVLMFGATRLPKPEMPKLLDEEKVTLDLWHWKDALLQPMQEKQSANPQLRCAWHFDEGKMSVLASRDTDQVSFLTPCGSRVLVQDGSPYAQRVSWDSRYTDVYVVNTVNGERQKIMSELRGRAQGSPDGKTVAAFRNGHWYVIDVASGAERCLTKTLPVNFATEDWDTPQPARAYGIAGWTQDGEHVLLNDRYDLWMVALDGSKVACVTDGWGRANRTTLRYTTLDREERFIPTDRALLLSATDSETMASGYYQDEIGGLGKPRKIVMLDRAFGRLTKAKKADRVVFSLTTFAECGDLWTSGTDLKDRRRLTDVNPQQKDYRWGKSELVRWHNADGVELKGFLVKPDGFDPKKKYPMMVYFYEKTSSRLHRYVSPSPGTSPNAAYYVSNGYLWFQPDIVYRDGYPGESCLKCVVSGVQSLIAKGFVDEESIGAAGHSWGGYQTAYLVTKTNIFKAVESGAPVSNMTSAYGGIRWGSGMSRAFQYERTQSRIGGSLWRYPLRYLENSPIFSADKVETPVLMLHNDQDGAVPWYQGIEYFCALRRLDREVYMFNYVGAGHGLRRRANQRDWTKRMQQYFDHHLKGAPAPKWMTDGVPYRERDREKLEFNPPKHPVHPKPEKKAEAVGTGTGGNQR